MFTVILFIGYFISAMDRPLTRGAPILKNAEEINRKRQQMSKSQNELQRINENFDTLPVRTSRSGRKITVNRRLFDSLENKRPTKTTSTPKVKQKVTHFNKCTPVLKIKYSW